MRAHRQDVWTRRGFSLLWEPRALKEVIKPGDVLSMRELFLLRGSWPETLPGGEGDALVVAGLDGCLDCLSQQDAIEWLEGDLKPVVLSFQEHYQGQAALILWLASGRARVGMDLADEEYFWRVSLGHDAPRIPLGRCLWGGAETDVARILMPEGTPPEKTEPDADGAAYVGLHHPRIS